MTGSPTTKIDAYYRSARGYSRILSFTIGHRFDLDESTQSVTLDLLIAASGRTVRLVFERVQSLEIARIHPGTSCHLSIKSIAKDQLEGLGYEVFKGEQDFTLSFVCGNFDVLELAE